MDAAPEIFPAAACAFPPTWGLKAYLRVTQSFGAKLCERENRIALGCSGSFVYAVACCEGWLQTLPGHKLRLRYSLRYGRAQLLPSIIWLTASPQDIAEAGGYTRHPAGSPLLPSVACAHLRGRIFMLQCLRSVVFGFCGIAQILQMVDSAGLAKAEYHQRIQNGEEPLFQGLRGPPGRVIRLAGRTSDPTVMSLAKYGPRIVPIYEQPDEASTASVIQRHSDQHKVPAYLRVAPGNYGKAEHWTHLHLDEEWFVTTRSGRRLLIAEADSSVGEEALALGSEQNNDLTHAECSLGFRMIERTLARGYRVLGVNGGAREVPPGASFGPGPAPSSPAPASTPVSTEVALARVVLIDETLPVVSGGGGRETVREYLAARDEADVFIDAKRPLLVEVTQWLRGCAGGAAEAVDAAGMRPVVFDTPNARYFKTVKAQLARRGIDVLDRCDARAHTSLPRLVYHDTTPETVNAALSLLRTARADAATLCVLLDHPEGLADMREQGLQDVPYICSSEVFDRKFAQVRNMLAQDVSVGEIQRLLDSEGALA